MANEMTNLHNNDEMILEEEDHSATNENVEEEDSDITSDVDEYTITSKRLRNEMIGNEMIENEMIGTRDRIDRPLLSEKMKH